MFDICIMLSQTVTRISDNTYIMFHTRIVLNSIASNLWDYSKNACLMLSEPCDALHWEMSDFTLGIGACFYPTIKQAMNKQWKTMRNTCRDLILLTVPLSYLCVCIHDWRHLTRCPMAKTHFMQKRGVQKKGDFCMAASMFLTGHGIKARTHAHAIIVYFPTRCIIRNWNALSLQPRASQGLMMHIVGNSMISAWAWFLAICMHIGSYKYMTDIVCVEHKLGRTPYMNMWFHCTGV